MDFRTEDDPTFNKSKWKLVYNLLRQDKDVLRKALNQINNALYVEFENVAKWAMNRASNSLTRRRFNLATKRVRYALYSGHRFVFVVVQTLTQN